MPSPTRAVHRTDLPGLPAPKRGKVRDVYDLGERLLIVATDRLSAFDHVLPTPIPDKGRVLNQLSAFWFERTASLVPNHVVETDAARFPGELQRHREVLEGRTTLARKLEMVPIECVARGYLSGSGWKEYKASGTVCGIRLPAGLRESDRLPEPIFTPATKAESGHDENISFEQAAAIVGPELAARLRAATLELYGAAADYARQHGVIIADTKFEFGLEGDVLVVADEMLTPDSSRFWPADQYAPGGAPPSFDKQYVRDWLDRSGWNREPPVPALPDDVVEGTRARYLEIHRILTGRPLQ